MTADVKAAARRLAESLPDLVHRARTNMHSDRRTVDAALDVLAEELEAFAQACAGQTSDPADIRLTADELDLVIRRLVGHVAYDPLSPEETTVIAKLRAARGTR